MKTLTPPGMAPHKLNIKVGAVYMLLRNLDVKMGLCNGSRLVVIQKHQHSLLCELIPTSATSDPPLQFLLPRITATPTGTYPFAFARHQFPIRPAFAVTINKSQGSTYNKVGINLTSHVFSHGQLYVALSRVKDWASVTVLLPEGHHTTKNIVWHNIFDREYIDRRIRETHPTVHDHMHTSNYDELSHPDNNTYDNDNHDYTPAISNLDLFLRQNPFHTVLDSFSAQDSFFPDISDDEIPADHWDND